MQNIKLALTSWVSQVDGTHKASTHNKSLGKIAPDQQLEVYAASAVNTPLQKHSPHLLHSPPAATRVWVQCQHNSNTPAMNISANTPSAAMA
jgi:hypothetical protein